MYAGVRVCIKIMHSRVEDKKVGTIGTHAGVGRREEAGWGRDDRFSKWNKATCTLSMRRHVSLFVRVCVCVCVRERES